jgi:hypothetical protein
VNNPQVARLAVTDDPLPRLRADFPQFRIWREQTPGRVRYVARRLDASVRPHTVITADPAELRRELSASRRLDGTPRPPAADRAETRRP